MEHQGVRKTAVKRTTVRKAIVKKVATRSTRASANLENRQIPTGYVRPAGVKRILAERQNGKH